MANSYSQTGEDRIVLFIMQNLHMNVITYLDIGAHDPIICNNTFMFYEMGYRGTLVEPNPEYANSIRLVRPGDRFIEAAVSENGKPGDVDLLVLGADTLSTTSVIEASRVVSFGHQSVVRRIPVKAVPINDLLLGCPQTPHFVSLDVEGIEHNVLASMDTGRFIPLIFCVETRVYREDNADEKNERAIEVMKDKGYMVFADTLINTIFVRRDVWENR